MFVCVCVVCATCILYYTFTSLYLIDHTHTHHTIYYTIPYATEARSPSVKKFREHIMTVLNDKHQTVITKTGAILAAGIIDAGM